jgi:MFS superfamily sulfate permease-like transporter
MKKKLRNILVISLYITTFTIIFDDWIWGVAVGAALGVVFTDNDKSCCK